MGTGFDAVDMLHRFPSMMLSLFALFHLIIFASSLPSIAYNSMQMMMGMMAGGGGMPGGAGAGQQNVIQVTEEEKAALDRVR